MSDNKEIKNLIQKMQGNADIGSGEIMRSANSKLNDVLKGGLLKGAITQLHGESGTGKTQMGMLFALGAVMSDCPAVYLCTEKDLSWVRYSELGYAVMNEAEFDCREKNLLLKKCADFSEAYHFVEESFKIIKEKGRGGILIIDSIYQLMTSCYEFHHIENDPFARSRRQAEFVNRVRWLAKVSHSAVLFINHAADSFPRNQDIPFKQDTRFSTKNIIAALGPSWDLQIDQNILLTRKGEIREICVVNSPKCLSGSKARFRIKGEGLVWVSEEGVEYE